MQNTDNVRVNDRISARQVRCISETGEAIGILSRYDALKMARTRGVDLIEIVPNANPPVCKLMPWGKYCYDLKKREKENRQVVKKIKEVNLHPSIDDNDLSRKISQITEFLGDGHPVRVFVSFRGRENAHKEFGWNIVNRILDSVKSVSSTQKPPAMQESQIVMNLNPKNRVSDQSVQTSAVAQVIG